MGLAQLVSNKMILNLSNLKRYEKQIIIKKIGISGQKKIINSKVLIIGIGGLGCPLLSYLAASGVGNIGIVDDDKVEIGNLNRQILFNMSDIGKYKVDCAKQKMTKINNRIKRAYRPRAADLGQGLYSAFFL